MTRPSSGGAWPLPERAALPLAVGALAVATGCASLSSVPGRELTQQQWERAVASRGVDPSQVQNPMRATEEMRKSALVLAGPGTDEEKLRRIQAALFDPARYTFEYEMKETLTAPEAFAQRRGNCVSFTNLFLALGRSLGIRLQAALLVRQPDSERQGDLVLVYNHVVAARMKGASADVYDFYRTAVESGYKLHALDDLSVAGIVASNRGVAFLRAGDIKAARAELETAVLLAPGLGSIHANLGLVRWREGDVAGAFAAYRQGLQAEPGSPSLRQNLAALYISLGRAAEARAALAATDLRNATPYSLLVMGDLELQAGHAKAALKRYRRARSLGPDLLEPLLGIARAERALGNEKAFRKAVLRAAKLFPNDPEVKHLLEAGSPSP